jgi:YVTN family beta-propeller protein
MKFCFATILAFLIHFAMGYAEPPAKIGYPSFMSPHASPILIHGDRVFVVNTPADTVDVIDSKTQKVVARIDVGIDPVSLALRPDGKEIWVANHISDSVSVIDTVPESPTFLHVVATVQDFDFITKSTQFDEPAGIAFASDKKAYVALSSDNRIAIINVATRKVEKHLTIPAQDPRSIIVRGDRLYVIPFESNNKTQLSGGYKIDGDLVTFNAHEHSIANNNVLSLGHVLDIIKHTKVPDHDLFVFDTKTDMLVKTVDTLGTLLYGMAVDSKGRVFVAQTDARNDANGRSGSKKHGLAELENRAFLNQITVVEADQKPKFFDLEPLPPKHPKPGMALATPFAIQVSADDSTLVVSAAGSDRVFTVDATSGVVLGRVDVGAVPRGIALGSGKAWVLNAVENTVSLIDVSNPATLKNEATISLEDPTNATFKRGRIAFNTAAASTTKTFSCASCHPDGHTDQLLWNLKTPIVTGGKQIMPRSTMPLRGLRDTAPFHWDGIPGDPYGGNNSANVYGHDAPNTSLDKPENTTRHVIDGALASTMSLVGAAQEETLLSDSERDALAKFLLGITFPPAQRRAYTNVLSKTAEEGFELFHIKGNHEGKPKPNVCGDCHRMPFWVSTNTPGTGMDAPTWRGAYDRFLILPQGRLNIIDFDFYRHVAERGIPERELWRFSWRSKPRFDPVWNMVLEGSTGFSGTFARQISLNKQTVDERQTNDLLSALESSADEGAIVLSCDGVFVEDKKRKATKFQFQSGHYVPVTGDGPSMRRDELVALAEEGKFVGTFTGRHGANADWEHPQPALWTLGSIHEQSGRQKFPVFYGDNKTMTVSGRHILADASLVVDGRKVPGSIQLEKEERIVIRLDSLPTVGLHFLQVQNAGGLFSNDFIFHVVEDAKAADALRIRANPTRLRDALDVAITKGDLKETKRLVNSGAPINARKDEGGAIPLSNAALHGELEIVKYLLEKNAKISHTNEDGNTALIVAAFICRTEIVELLLERGASIQQKNNSGETAISVVSGEWNDGLSGFYKFISDSANLDLDLNEIESLRPKMAKLLIERAAK